MKMSSTISPTQTKTIIPKVISQLKMDEKPARLVRASSIDKIKRFNTYICSQQYYIVPAVPAILNWLKSSENGHLPSSTEKTIVLFRALIFNSFLFKFFSNGLKTIATKNINLIKNPQDIQSIISNFYRKFTNCFESTFLLPFAFYLGSLLIFAQLLWCVYLLAFVVVPLGLVFLLGCMFVSVHLCHRMNGFYKKQSDIRHKKSIKVKCN